MTTSFTLSGSIYDYEATTQTSIKATLAREARVTMSAVTLTLASGSVIFTAQIALDSQVLADSTAAVLASGIMSGADSLREAIISGLAADGISTAGDLIVQAIAPVTTAQDQTSALSGSTGSADANTQHLPLPLFVWGGVIAALGLIATLVARWSRRRRASKPSVGRARTFPTMDALSAATRTNMPAELALSNVGVVLEDATGGKQLAGLCESQSRAQLPVLEI